MNMNTIIKNIAERKEMILTEVSFHANDYKNYPVHAQLAGSDAIVVKEVLNDKFLVSYSRRIAPTSGIFFDVSASFDIVFHFIKPYDEKDIPSMEDVKKVLLENDDELLSPCASKLSFIIAQLTSHVGDGVPVIAPPSPFKKQ